MRVTFPGLWRGPCALIHVTCVYKGPAPSVEPSCDIGGGITTVGASRQPWSWGGDRPTTLHWWDLRERHHDR